MLNYPFLDGTNQRSIERCWKIMKNYDEKKALTFSVVYANDLALAYRQFSGIVWYCIIIVLCCIQMIVIIANFI